MAKKLSTQVIEDMEHVVGAVDDTTMVEVLAKRIRGWVKKLKRIDQRDEQPQVRYRAKKATRKAR